MENINYTALIHKQITGEISPADSQVLASWLRENEEHAAMAEQIRGIWIASHTKTCGWEPDVEGGLKQLRQRIDREEMTKVSRRPAIFTLLRYAAAAVFLFSLGYYVNGVGTASELSWNVAETSVNEIETIQLEDGSEVTINGGTYFSYPESFVGGKRRVKLDGEGFFDIARDESLPFFVEMDHGTVQVLGTSFNIINDVAANTTTISVATGRVAFVPKGSQQEFILKADDKLIYNANTQQYRQVKDLSPNDWSWKTKKLVFKDTKLAEVIPAIEKHFAIQLSLNNQQLAKCRNLTATFSDISRQDMLAALKLTVGVEVRKAKEEDSFVLFGGTCE